MVIEKTGHFVNLSTGSLRELRTGLCGASAWEGIYEAADFTANKADAGTHELKSKPLFAEARDIVEILAALSETQEDEAVPTNLGDDLE